MADQSAGPIYDTPPTCLRHHISVTDTCPAAEYVVYTNTVSSVSVIPEEQICRKPFSLRYDKMKELFKSGNAPDTGKVENKCEHLQDIFDRQRISDLKAIE